MDKERRSGTLHNKTLIVMIGLLIIITMITIILWKSPMFMKNDFSSSELMNLINTDQGLMNAVEHDFIQIIEQSDEHEGIKITVESVIVDEAKMIVLYSMEGVRDFKRVYSKSVELLKINGEIYGAGSTYNSPVNNEEQSNIIYDRIDFYFFDENKPEDMILKLKLEAGNTFSDTKELESTWSIPFKVDKKKFQNKSRFYSINKTVQIEGQSLSFHDLTIYPIRSELLISIDENNSKEIFGFEDLRISDHEGNVWETVSSGFIGKQLNDTEQLVYLESNYFDHPEEMYIELSTIRAMNKNELQFNVDLSQNDLGTTSNENISLIINKDLENC
ncbi:DUF4179 domain-containing protein [Chengkuizengella axinellae]|uniref:DUF4179 domain-containing protein n=1 Tax=Chengkuizengella axinellae TaxID=3064388 RepID=A0ABT9J1T4_9BACL|nr:DUF4179 domain-containing protein [Chengkuizengella sp. 2205SS18-9]MDP5275572.1 DUF4179 domain-containing protein [Chengkuizengella sp. 2205SS18-9]